MVMGNPKRRAEDTGTLATINKKMEDYRVFIYAIIGIALALGFRYVTPNERFKKIEDNQAKFQQNITELKDTTISQARNIKGITLLQCFNKNYTSGQLRLVGIDCTGIR